MALEREIHVQGREDLIYLLAEAAEIEHNLMCCYLFAAFGLKTEADGLSAAEAAEVERWKRQVISVAVEEMSHLSLVANLTLAIGGSPHFGRPNFPVASGFHPAGVIVELRRFDRATLDHFIYLERPEGVELADGDAFAHPERVYVREMGKRLTPSAQDYATVGHLYRGIRRAVESLGDTLGEAQLFVGDPALQVGPEFVALPGLIRVVDRASALKALDTIVEQGEGSSADVEHSHYRRFLAIRDAYDKALAANPNFEPSRPLAPNPVMRTPPEPAGKTYVDAPEAASTLDLANALYGAMLRALAQGFAERDRERKRAFLDVAIEGMFLIAPVAEHLSTLPASPQAPGLNAGMTFAMLRDVAAMPDGASAALVVAERLAEICVGVERVLPSGELAAKLVSDCRRLSQRLSPAKPKEPPPMSTPEIETAEGADVIIAFEGKRCIHARFCVLQQPGVFKANVVGAWIAPDDATSTEGLIATAENCPSGAIQFQRKDGGPAEAPPPVNLIQLRENGPLALRGALTLDGKSIGTRATLCRCGESHNKPFCDGSHKDAAFSATGEPATGDVTALPKRDGEVAMAPLPNGPLRVAGNLEVISGTGRTIAKSTELYLCRCGHSANKPYCDGSHARVGFKG
jgi:CDGSH-type Zn-finger protein/uncharacterized Fe-S cluster protein YjdI